MKTYCSTPATMGNKDLSTHDCSTKMTVHHSLQDYSPKSFISWTYHFWMSIFRQFMAFGISIFWQIFDLVKNIIIQISDFWLAIICQIVVFPISLINHLYIWWLVFVVRATSVLCLLGLGLGLGSILIYRLCSRLFASGNATQTPSLTARGRRRSSQSSLDENSDSRRLSPQQEAAAKLVPVSDVTVSHVSPAEEDLTYDDVKNHNLIVCTQESPSGSNDILNLNDQECRKFSRRARTNTLETVWEQSGNYSGVVDEQLGNISDVDAFHKFLRDNRICESIHDSGIGDSSNRSSALFNDVDETGSSEIFDEFVEEKDEKLIEAEWSVSSALRKLLSTNPSHWMDLELKRGKSHKRRWSCSEFKKDWGQIVLKKVLFADAKCETSTPHWVLEELLDL